MIKIIYGNNYTLIVRLSSIAAVGVEENTVIFTRKACISTLRNVKNAKEVCEKWVQACEY